MHVDIQQLEIFGIRFRLTVLVSPGFEGHARKASKLLDGSGDRRVLFMNVKLDGLHSWALAGVFHINRYARFAARMNLRRRNAQIAILKLGIAQPVTE